MVRKTSAGLFASIYADRPHLAGSTRYDDFVTSRPPPEPVPCNLSKSSFSPDVYTKPYLDFMTNNPTVFDAVDWVGSRLTSAGYRHLSERDTWNTVLKPGGKYYTTRNGSAIIAFAVGEDYKPGNGIGIVAGHIDALTAKLKPIPTLQNKAGYVQLGVAPYAGGGVSSTWWDRDLGIGGRVLVKDLKTGKIETQLVKLDWPIARIPTLAVHFGAAAQGPFNPETQMVPIIGLDNSDLSRSSTQASSKIPAGTFAATQPERLVRAIAGKMDVEDYSSIVNWELELFDIQPAQLGGLDKEFIFAGRIDDKLCSWAAIEALLASSDDTSTGIIKMVGCFDNEEIGSFLRQGARSNFMSSVVERICEGLSDNAKGSFGSMVESPSCGPNLLSQVLANSFLVSSDVCHAVNPNFLGVYLENHSPRLNVGIAVTVSPSVHGTRTKS
jgi:aminopeptidase I